ncbi:MAG: hypothetical protein IT368_02115, partial [Candidatus Hydrogenedentes bacterium]|nr:hypothetical protein [Candidatus Hydrogenedentota bacterium]
MRVFTDPTANSLARGSRPKSGIVTAIFLLLASLLLPAHADSLQEIIQGGVLRHLGIPYANFVTGFGTGMDVELVQGFARKLGLRYEYVETDWDRIFGDLTGQEVSYRNGELVRG